MARPGTAGGREPGLVVAPSPLLWPGLVVARACCGARSRFLLWSALPPPVARSLAGPKIALGNCHRQAETYGPRPWRGQETAPQLSTACGAWAPPGMNLDLAWDRGYT